MNEERHSERPEDEKPEPQQPSGSTVVLPGGRRPGAPMEIGDYVVESLIGRGGMGIVYRARHKELKRTVAIKLLVEGPHAMETMRKRFQREAKAMARLRHPNIVGVHEVGEHDGQPYFVMDYIDGLPLKRFVLKLPSISNTVIADICMRMTEAVQYAHDNGIVHRDLKPDNILINGHGDPIVTDFGLAKDIRGEASLLSMTGDVMGTPAFMAPEQARGQISKIDARTDVYSMGAILYWLLTRQEPFHGKTIMETLTRVAYEEPPTIRKYNPHIESELNAICMKAMEKDKRDRYQSAEEMGEDLKRFIDGYPVRAKPQTWERAIRRFTVQHQKALAGAAVALTVAAVAMTVLYLVFSKTFLEHIRPRLESGDAAIRIDAINALGQEILAPDRLKENNVSDAVDLLLSNIDDPDPRVEGALVRFLVAHGDEIFIKRRFTDAHKQWLMDRAADDARPELSRAALEAVGRIRMPEFAEYLIHRLHESNPGVRMRVIRALGDQGTRRAYEPLMRIIINDPVCRTEAEEAMQKLYDMETLVPFKRYQAASGALKQLGSALAQYNTQVEQALHYGASGSSPKPRGPYYHYEQALRSGDTNRQIKAAYELGRTGDSAAAPLLIDALDHTNRQAGAAAALALARVTPDDLTDRLQPSLKSPHPARRGHAALALGFSRRPAALDSLLIMLSSETDVYAKRQIIRALGELGRPEAAPGLRAAAEQDPRVAADAASVLHRLHGSDSQ